MTAILGVLLFTLGVVATFCRVSLFLDLKNKYPIEYQEIGSPSVLLPNLNPIIDLGIIKSKIEQNDFAKYKKLRLLVYSSEAALAACILIFVARMFSRFL